MREYSGGAQNITGFHFIQGDCQIDPDRQNHYFGVLLRTANIMNIHSFKTKSAREADIKRAWYVVDGEGLIVGRLASQIASILRGKHKPSFTPHVDTGDFVIVVNADKVRFTGNKENAKLYYSYSGYPSGLKSRTALEMRKRRPEHLMRHAIKGMLPKGRLGRQMLKKLKVYASPSHPHEAQQPDILVFTA